MLEAGEAGAVEWRDAGSQIVHGDGLAQLAVERHHSGPGGSGDIALVFHWRTLAHLGGDFLQGQRQHGVISVRSRQFDERISITSVFADCLAQCFFAPQLLRQ